MAIKHQTDSFRTIGGERYICWCDVLGHDDEREVLRVKSLGLKHRVFKHPDGFRRLFVREADTAAL